MVTGLRLNRKQRIRLFGEEEAARQQAILDSGAINPESDTGFRDLALTPRHERSDDENRSLDAIVDLSRALNNDKTGETKLDSGGSDGTGETIRRNQNALDVFGHAKGFKDKLQRNLDNAKERAGDREASVAASRTSQRNTNAINKLVLSGRKKPRGASVALPRAAGLLANKSRSLLI